MVCKEGLGVLVKTSLDVRIRLMDMEIMDVVVALIVE
jgi:hypothetical protein